MTLASELLEKGWREFQEGEKWVAERFASRPGATSSIIRVESESRKGLNDAVKLRESQLTGTEEDIKDTITNDGTLVTGPQHESIRTEGVTVVGAASVAEPVPNEDEAKQVAGLENAGFNPDTPYDPTEAAVDTPQVPADAADKGLSPEAISASETGSGSADTSTQPEAQAMPASFAPPEGADSLPEEDRPALNTEGGDEANNGAPADVASSTAGSQNTPSVDASPAAVKLAEEKAIDLSQVTGTGKDGKVTQPDVKAHIEAQPAPEAPAVEGDESPGDPNAAGDTSGDTPGAADDSAA